MRKTWWTAITVLSMLFGALCTQASDEERATITIAGDLCRVQFREIDREVKCSAIVPIMQGELKIPSGVHVITRASGEPSYEQVAPVLSALRDSGYVLRVGFIDVPHDGK